MSMSFTRYKFVRDKLIELYSIITGRHYEVWITPASMMTLEQLRERETFTLGDSVPYDEYYTEFQKRRITIAGLTKYLDNLDNSQDIGFINPNKTVVEIYEGIQEYISLWLEVRRDAHNFNTPLISELRKLERVAYLVFPHYKRLKTFSTNEKLRELADSDTRMARVGLAGLGSILSMSSLNSTPQEEELSFISHIDNFENANDFSSPNVSSVTPSKLTGIAAEVVTKANAIDNLLGGDNSNPDSWIFDV